MLVSPFATQEPKSIIPEQSDLSQLAPVAEPVDGAAALESAGDAALERFYNRQRTEIEQLEWDIAAAQADFEAARRAEQAENERIARLNPYPFQFVEASSIPAERRYRAERDWELRNHELRGEIVEIIVHRSGDSVVDFLARQEEKLQEAAAELRQAENLWQRLYWSQQVAQIRYNTATGQIVRSALIVPTDPTIEVLFTNGVRRVYLSSGPSTLDWALSFLPYLQKARAATRVGRSLDDIDIGSRNGRGLLPEAPAPTGPHSSAIRELFLRNAESSLFRWRVNVWNRIVGNLPIDWDDFMRRLRTADFREYSSTSEAIRSLGFAGPGPNGWLFGLTQSLRRIPVLANTAARHELFHAVDDFMTGILTRPRHGHRIKMTLYHSHLSCPSEG